ncbi:MAG TPA: bifunctional DNA primase/polymerase [Syntrophales bacterium]|nr:bifunctional DNA primase/polymerase [Syntrophales bacterium]
MRTDMLHAALDYAGRGLSVIPIRPDKKPFIPWAAYQKQFATPEEIRSWWADHPDAMVGLVTGTISGILVIDCDTPEGFEAVRKMLPDALILPIARTPRGGWHLWFVYPAGSGITVGTGVIPGVDFRGEGGYIIAPPSVNGNGKAYTWEEGKSIGDVPLGTVPLSLIKKLSLYRGSNADRRHKATNGDNGDKYFHQGRRDEDLFTVANSLIKNRCAPDFSEYVLNILANNSNPPFPENEIRAKIDSAMKRSERRERNIAAEVREWVLATNGVFLATNFHQEATMATREEKQAANLAFRRLCEGPEPLLERYGNQRGCYRRIDRTIEFMDFENADPGKSIDLRLPLDIHKKTKLFRKAVIVIAGVSGMGKTLFALNAIRENMGRMPALYYNAEMGAEALHKKLRYFPDPISEWARGMKVVDGWDFNSITDKIQPDAFNVVDYLEPDGDKPYNIHGVISNIIRRLDQGVALITVQKKPEARMGTGGVYSLKAATLALALDWGKIEIVKNRFREEDPNPSANKISFDVKAGWEIVRTCPWHS